MIIDTYYCTKCKKTLELKDCEITGKWFSRKFRCKECKINVSYSGPLLIFIGFLILGISSLILCRGALECGIVISGPFFAVGTIRTIGQLQTSIKNKKLKT